MRRPKCRGGAWPVSCASLRRLGNEEFGRWLRSPPALALTPSNRSAKRKIHVNWEAGRLNAGDLGITWKRLGRRRAHFVGPTRTSDSSSSTPRWRHQASRRSSGGHPVSANHNVHQRFNAIGNVTRPGSAIARSRGRPRHLSPQREITGMSATWSSATPWYVARLPSDRLYRSRAAGLRLSRGGRGVRHRRIRRGLVEMR